MIAGDLRQVAYLCPDRNPAVDSGTEGDHRRNPHRKIADAPAQVRSRSIVGAGPGDRTRDIGGIGRNNIRYHHTRGVHVARIDHVNAVFDGISNQKRSPIQVLGGLGAAGKQRCAGEHGGGFGGIGGERLIAVYSRHVLNKKSAGCDRVIDNNLIGQRPYSRSGRDHSQVPAQGGSPTVICPQAGNRAWHIACLGGQKVGDDDVGPGGDPAVGHKNRVEQRSARACQCGHYRLGAVGKRDSRAHGGGGRRRDSGQLISAERGNIIDDTAIRQSDIRLNRKARRLHAAVLLEVAHCPADICDRGGVSGLGAPCCAIVDGELDGYAGLGEGTATDKRNACRNAVHDYHTGCRPVSNVGVVQGIRYRPVRQHRVGRIHFCERNDRCVDIRCRRGSRRRPVIHGAEVRGAYQGGDLLVPGNRSGRYRQTENHIHCGTGCQGPGVGQTVRIEVKGRVDEIPDAIGVGILGNQDRTGRVEEFRGPEFRTDFL